MTPNPNPSWVLETECLAAELICFDRAPDRLPLGLSSGTAANNAEISRLWTLTATVFPAAAFIVYIARHSTRTTIVPEGTPINCNARTLPNSGTCQVELPRHPLCECVMWTVGVDFCFRLYLSPWVLFRTLQSSLKERLQLSQVIAVRVNGRKICVRVSMGYMYGVGWGSHYGCHERMCKTRKITTLISQYLGWVVLSRFCADLSCCALQTPNWPLSMSWVTTRCRETGCRMLRPGWGRPCGVQCGYPHHVHSGFWSESGSVWRVKWKNEWGHVGVDPLCWLIQTSAAPCLLVGRKRSRSKWNQNTDFSSFCWVRRKKICFLPKLLNKFSVQEASRAKWSHKMVLWSTV